MRKVQLQNFEKSHGTTKVKGLSSCFQVYCPLSPPWKTGTSKFAWETPSCHKKWVYIHKVYNFSQEPPRQSGKEVVLPPIPHNPLVENACLKKKKGFFFVSLFSPAFFWSPFFLDGHCFLRSSSCFFLSCVFLFFYGCFSFYPPTKRLFFSSLPNVFV